MEWAIHAPIAGRSGIAPDVIDAIAQRRKSPTMQPDEAVVFDFCVELHRSKRVSDATYAHALALFGEQGVVDLMGINGYYTFLAMVMNAAQTAAPASTAPPLPAWSGITPATQLPRIGSDCMSMSWDEHFLVWERVHRDPGPACFNGLQAARKRVATNTREDWVWLAEALGDERRKFFVAMVFRLQSVPRRLLAGFISAAVSDLNPSRNKFYIHPCVRTYGSKEVVTRLLRIVEVGSNEEQCGAVSALYWAYGNQRNDDLSELREWRQRLLLMRFIDNDDLNLRRRILPALSFDARTYPAELVPLLATAMAIARSHPDEYIRHRSGIQMGQGGPLMPLPSVGAEVNARAGVSFAASPVCGSASHDWTVNYSTRITD